MGGKVSDLGQVTTRADLIDVLTMVIFTSSAQHAAVNYPQADQMQDANSVPLALYGNVNTDPVEKVLPPKEMRTLQKQVVDLLAGTSTCVSSSFSTHLPSSRTVRRILHQARRLCCLRPSFLLCSDPNQTPH